MKSVPAGTGLEKLTDHRSNNKSNASHGVSFSSPAPSSPAPSISTKYTVGNIVKMVSFVSTLLLATAAVVSAGGGQDDPMGYEPPGSVINDPFKPFSGDMFMKYNLSANGIKASWIPYGARLTNLYVKDRNGTWQDIVVGYDEGIQYLHDTETNHTYFGAVVGRYANRLEGTMFASPLLTAADFSCTASRMARSQSTALPATSRRTSTEGKTPFMAVS